MNYYQQYTEAEFLVLCKFSEKKKKKVGIMGVGIDLRESLFSTQASKFYLHPAFCY